MLYDPAGLYQACANSGASDASAINLAVPPGLAITTKCTTTAIASQWVPTDLRWALATTMVGASAAIPPPYVAPPSRPDLDGTISAQWCTSAVTDSLPCGRTYPNNASTDPMTWVADATTTSTGSKIFLPYVPPVIDTPAFAGGYDLDLGGGQKCKIFFPGRYTDNVVITGTTPVYFVSGVYYFEKAVRLSGDAQVVVGAGAVDGCVDSDAIAVADAGYADATSNGVGGTFVFGAQGRLVIDTTTASTTGSGVSLTINRRLVDPTDPENIMARATESAPRHDRHDSFGPNDLCQLAGLTEPQLAELESYGLLAGKGSGAATTYTSGDLAIAQAAAGFMQLGIEGRHLKAWRQAAEREASLFEQMILPLLRQRNPQARQQAVETLTSLTELGGELRSAIVHSALSHHLDG